VALDLRPGRRWVLVDVLVAVVALATELPAYAWQGPWVVTGEVVLAAVIATRRLMPFVAATVYGLAFTAQALVTVDSPEDQLCLIGAVALSYTFGTLRGWSRSVAGLVLVVAGGCAHEIWAGSDYTFVLGLAVVGWLPGVVVRSRAAEVARLQGEAQALLREQGLREEAAAAAERNRLARELHDAVSHSVSAMVVQAAAAEQVLPRDPAAAVEALRRVQQTGRDSIAELHRLLGVLQPAGTGTPTAAAPGLATIAELVADARTAGQDVRLEMPTRPPELPVALQLSAYRIVQESLTNARKYAPGSPVWVRVELQGTQLEVEVVDVGGGPAGASGGGRGLRGLQERAAVFGGTVDAGRRDDGFAVSAHLPVPVGS